MKQKLLLFWLFYVVWIIPSTILSIILVYLDVHFITAAFAKAFLATFLYYYQVQTRRNQQWIFFNNQGISSYMMFLVALVMDVVMMALLYLIDSWI